MEFKNIKNVVVEGTFRSNSGYSKATREFFNAFVDKYPNKNYYFIDKQWDAHQMELSDDYDNITTNFTTLNPELHEIMTKDKKNTMFLRWGVPVVFPDDIENVPAKIKAIYFVWEMDQLPPLWIDAILKYDVIFTASKFSMNAIMKSLQMVGSYIPVLVVPHGVSDEYMPKLTIDANRQKSDMFRFLYVGSLENRKDVFGMIKTYLDTFDGNNKVDLFIKLNGINANQVVSIKNHIQKMNMDKIRVNAPKIIIDINNYDEVTLAELYNTANVMCLVSKGEAFLLPALEAMACGIPSITLNEGGHRTFCTIRSSYFVKSTGTSRTQGSGWMTPENGAKWLDIDYKDMSKIMKYVYNNPENLKFKSDNGLERAEKYTWKNVIAHFRKVFNTQFSSNK